MGKRNINSKDRNLNEDATKVQPGTFVLTVGNGSDELPDYEVLAAEEPIKTNICEIKQEMGKVWEAGEEPKPQLRFVFKVAPGQPGEGQQYSKWVNAPTSNTISPKSGVYGILAKVYPDGIPENFELTDAVGMPVRIELSYPYDSNGKTRQKVTAIKTATKDQERIVASVEAFDAFVKELEPAQATAAAK